MQVKRKEIEFEGKIITLEAGRLARQANGAVIVQCEDTMVIVTAVTSDEPLEDVDFFPL
ncbi:MAG: hypothetical protein AB1466_00880, partial [Actinomycetota bacterium]